MTTKELSQKNEIKKDQFTGIKKVIDIKNKYLIFNIAQKTYGINIPYITEIIKTQSIIKMPDIPSLIKVAINLKENQSIRVLDLRLLFKIKSKEYDDKTCIVIINIDSSVIGFLVDKVIEVVDIEAYNIKPPSQLKIERRIKKYISGIGEVNGEVKFLLDVKKIINIAELKQKKQFN